MDVNAEKIAAPAAGRTPFFEPGLDEMLAEQVASGRLRFTTSPALNVAAAILPQGAQVTVTTGRRTTPPRRTSRP